VRPRGLARAGVACRASTRFPEQRVELAHARLREQAARIAADPFVIEQSLIGEQHVT
jgi:hypothetical protein